MAMAPLETKDFVDQYAIKDAPEDLNDSLRNMATSFAVTDQKMKEIISYFHESMQAGLDGNQRALPMIPTFVRARPTGKEQGTFLSLI